MRWIFLVLAPIAALLVSVRVANATPITFVASLSGASEVPPNNSPGTGFATVVLDPVADTLFIDVTFSGLLGQTTASHIHCCLPFPEAPQNAIVATTIPTFPDFPLGVKSGTYVHLFDLTDPATYNPAFVTAHGGTVAGAEAALVAGIEARETYLNIHTTEFGGGEIRGFLVPAPEPATLPLLGSGLGLAALTWRHRRN